MSTDERACEYIYWRTNEKTCTDRGVRFVDAACVHEHVFHAWACQVHADRTLTNPARSRCPYCHSGPEPHDCELFIEGQVSIDA